MTADPVLVAGEFADGAYGPTIVLRSSSPQGVELLKTIFERMARGGPATALMLADQSGIVLGATVWGLRLKRISSPQPRRLSRDGDGGFTWVGTPDEWRRQRCSSNRLRASPDISI